MKLAITGCNGSVGRRVVTLALKHGHAIIGIDCSPASDTEFSKDSAFSFLQADIREYDETLEALKGQEGVIHVAGIRNPGDYAVNAHNRYYFVR